MSEFSVNLYINIFPVLNSIPDYSLRLTQGPAGHLYLDIAMRFQDNGILNHTSYKLKAKWLSPHFPKAWSLSSPPDLRSTLCGLFLSKELLKPILHSS